MENTLIFEDILETLKSKAKKGYFLFQEEDLLIDSNSRRKYNLIFHVRNGLDIEKFKELDYSIIPVLEPQEGSEDTKIITFSYLINSDFKTAIVNHQPPKLYDLVGTLTKSDSIIINERKYYPVDRTRLYKRGGKELKKSIEQRISEINKIE